MKKNKSIRLSKFLSNAGIASRRKADEMISAGIVTVNGEIVTEAWRSVNSKDKILINGKEVKEKTGKIYIMLNKPTGVVSSCADEHAEITVADIVKVRGVRLFPVGRLDKNSEGLLLLTNDGEFANKITHPKYGITKTYMVHTDKDLKGEDIQNLLRGFRDSGEFIKAEKIFRRAEKLYQFVMKEGKKREIRRLIKRTGASIRKLRRMAIGGLFLDKRLPVGKWRYLSKAEIETLQLKNKENSKFLDG